MNQTVLVRCPCCAHIITVELSSEQPCQDKAKEPPASKPATEEEKSEFDKQLDKWKEEVAKVGINKGLERATPTQQVDSNYVIGKEITEQLNHPVTSWKVGTLTTCPMCHGKRELLDFEILEKKRICPLCKGWGVIDSLASRLDQKVMEEITHLTKALAECSCKTESYLNTYRCGECSKLLGKLEKLVASEVVNSKMAAFGLSLKEEKVIDAAIAELKNGMRGCTAECCFKCDSLRERINELEKLKKGEVK